MALQETNISKQIQKTLSKMGTRLFRVNTGTAWAGKPIKLAAGQLYKAKHGDVVIQGAYPVRMGLINGGSDLIGWHPIVITPEMVGKRVAVFAAPEVKTDVGGNGNPDQKNFIKVVKEAGGIAGIVRSDDEAAALIAAWPN